MNFAEVSLASKYLKSIKSISEDKAHYHGLKHSVAVQLANLWATLQEIREYLWHKRIESTLVYFSYTTQQNNNFYEKINKNGKLV